MKEIGQYFKERFEQFEPNPPSDFWSKIQNDKALKRFNKIQSFKKFLKIGIPSAAVIVASVFIWIAQFSVQKPNNDKVIVAQKVDNSIPSEVILETSKTSNDAIKQNKENGYVNSIKNELKTNDEILRPNESTSKTNVANTENNSKTNKNITTIQQSNYPIPHSFPLITSNNEEKNLKSETEDKNKANISQLNSENTNETQIDQTLQDKVNTTDPENEINKILVPNSFTPNGDGVNDQFFAKAEWEVEDFELYIYERSGALVFKTKDINLGWDGTNQGLESHAGVYAYFLIYKDKSGNMIKTKGTLNLIR